MSQDVANGQAVAAELIKAGGSVSAKNALGWSPLHCAMYTNNLDVARLLIRAGADPSAENARGVAAKDMVQRCDPHVVDSLVESGRFHQQEEGAAVANEEGEPPEIVERRDQIRREHAAARIDAAAEAELLRVEMFKNQRKHAEDRRAERNDRQLGLQYAMAETVRANKPVLKVRRPNSPLYASPRLCDCSVI